MKNDTKRIKKTKLNIVSNVFIMIVRIVLLFIVRIVFIRTLGKTYLGLDSLFTNLLSVLSIADLGITSAVNFVLYKPLSENNTKKVSSIMTYYKKMYMYMGSILLVVGLILTLFLPFIVKENINNLYLIYFMYLFNTVSTYFISYKESLIVADQNRYKLSLINFSFYVTLYGLRIVALLYTKNFLVYVLLLDVITLIQRVLINRYVTFHYKEIDFNSKNELEKEEKENILTRIKAMFVHKIGSFVINGTDSVVISATAGLGVAVVGIYTNYLSIIMTASSLFEQVYKGITSSFGDLAAQENEKTQENVFNIIGFIGYLMYGLTSVGFYFLLSPLIKMCFGEQFVISNIIVIFMICNFYFSGIIASIDMIKEATGEYVVDKYVPLIQSIINLVVSIVLAKFIGLLGVVLGTTVSYVTVSLWNRPYIAYKYIFKSSKRHFIIEQLKYILTLILVIFVVDFILQFIIINNDILSFLATGIICVFVFMVFTVIVFFRDEEFKFIKNEIFKVLKK